jgi:hypothetical protein
VRCANSLRPENRVNACGAGDSDADDQVLGDWGVNDQEEDVAEEGDGFDLQVRGVSGSLCLWMRW